MDEPKTLAARREGWFGRRTDEHFSRLVEDLEELDAPVQQAVRAALWPGENVVMMIYAPYQGVLAQRAKQKRAKMLAWKFTPDWLLVLSASRLLLIQTREVNSTVEILSIPLEDILSLQNGTVLLFSWFEVCWAESGSTRRQIIYFNAVCERFYSRLTGLIRAHWRVGDAYKPGPCSLDDLPFKFKNLLPLRVFLPGEQVECVLFRPSLWHTRMRFLKHMTAPRMVLALTASCLVLAEEDLTGEDGSYGFIVTCLPRMYLKEPSVIPGEDGPQLHFALQQAGASLAWSLPFPPQFETALASWYL